MTEEDPLKALRDLPLPDIAPGLSAKIRGEAHRRLRAGARSATGPRGTASRLLHAAVILVCVSHLGWTLIFMQKVQVPAAAKAVSVLR
jgi:hypothetical protein